MDFRGVLKKHDVRMVGGTRAPAAPRPAAAGPQARIVSQNDSEAIVEITCPCGQKTQIRCAFGRGGQ